MRTDSTNMTTTISGSFSGSQVAIGNGIAQHQTIGHPTLGEHELEHARRLFEDLRTQVQRAAPSQEIEAATKRIAKLERALLDEPEPDMETAEGVGNWFRRNLPQFAGTVGSVVLGPLVGKLVGSGSELLAEALFGPRPQQLAA